MMSMLKEEQDPRALGHTEIFDTYQYMGGRGKGYETWLKEQESRLNELKAQLEAGAAKKAEAAAAKKAEGGAKKKKAAPKDD